MRSAPSQSLAVVNILPALNLRKMDKLLSFVFFSFFSFDFLYDGSSTALVSRPVSDGFLASICVVFKVRDFVLRKHFIPFLFVKGLSSP